MISEETKALFAQIVHDIMRENSYGVKGGKYSCDLNAIIYKNTTNQNRNHRDGLLELADNHKIEDYGYKVFEYHDKNKVFYYKP